MKVYLDTSAVIPLFVDDDHTPHARRMAKRFPSPCLISDLTRAEFSAAVSRRFRMKLLTRETALTILDQFDNWSDTFGADFDVEAGDLAAADRLVRRFELKLRTPDALHLVLARRAQAMLATFDARLADAATALGLTRLT